MKIGIIMDKKIVLYIAMSFDGFIADKHGQVDWLQPYTATPEPDDRYEKFIDTIDTLIMGHNTYRQIVDKLSPNYWPYPDKTCYVLSEQEQEQDYPNINFINQEITDFIHALPNGNIWIVGGAKLINTLIRQDLIDEYQITLIPTLLGKGLRLFDGNNPMQTFQLSQYSEVNGLITLQYNRYRI